MEVLTNKEFIPRQYISRYSNFPIYFNKLKEKHVSSMSTYLNNATPYESYRVKKGDTFDSIALEMYGNPTLYWIICNFNHIPDPFREPIAGMILKIPSLSEIEF